MHCRLSDGAVKKVELAWYAGYIQLGQEVRYSWPVIYNQRTRAPSRRGSLQWLWLYFSLDPKEPRLLGSAPRWS